MRMSARTRQREMKALRQLIETTDDRMVARIAYGMEIAVSKVTKSGLVGWPKLTEEAKLLARLLRQETATTVKPCPLTNSECANRVALGRGSH
jgi:hypothetical protein